MKKILTITIICIVLVIGSVIAVLGIANIDKDLNIKKEYKVALESKGITNYAVEDFDIGDDYIERCLISPSDYNLPCQRFQTYWMNCTEYDLNTSECLNEVRIYYTELELKNMKDTWEKERIEGIADAIIQRQVDTTRNKTKEGITTLKEKKAQQI